MSDILRVLYDQFHDHMRKYNRPPDKFELSKDMYEWFLQDANPYEIIYDVDQKTNNVVTKFMGVPIIVLPEYSTTITIRRVIPEYPSHY